MLYNELWWLWILMGTTHFVCALAIVLPQYFFEKNPLAWQMVTIAAMTLQVTNIAFVCDNFANARVDLGVDQLSKDYTNFAAFLEMEVVVFIGILLANMIFLFIRSLID